ncbi:MAG: enoyl-CoA hydratase-related protein [Flavobacteriales bacterium]
MSTLLKSQIGGVAILTLNRPDKFNSFNKEMAMALQEALDAAEHDPEVRAIILTGAGKAFCAGQDLQEAVEDNGIDITRIVSAHYNPIIGRIRSIEKPVIAAVNGVAAGAGANIALACDLCIASEHAAFIQAFSKIGLIPDSGGTFFLPRLVGMQRATALMMLGDKLMAAEAADMGMIYRSVPADNLAEEARILAERLAAMPTKALGLTKRALNKSLEQSLGEQLALEGELQTAASGTQDYNEGVAAFLEKRKPEFKGA